MADLFTMPTEAEWTRWPVYVWKQDRLKVRDRCPVCGRYLKRGTVEINLAGSVRLTGWSCAKHGEVQPYREFIEDDEEVRDEGR